MFCQSILNNTVIFVRSFDDLGHFDLKNSHYQTTSFIISLNELICYELVFLNKVVAGKMSHFCVVLESFLHKEKF